MDAVTIADFAAQGTIGTAVLLVYLWHQRWQRSANGGESRKDMAEHHRMMEQRLDKLEDGVRRVHDRIDRILER